MKKMFACVAVSLLLTGAASAQTWSQNFNGGGTFPPAGWSVDDLLGAGVSIAMGWDYNYNILDGADPRGNFSSGDGGAAHIDTDARVAGSGAYNKALVSPTFTVPAGATLDFVINYQDLNGDSASVEINDGSGWDNLVTYTTEQGGFPVFPYSGDEAIGAAKSLDISAYAGSDAQVRFRYAGNGWNWWMQVDDIAVTPEPASVALLALGGLAMFRRR
jgi:hypothetical protein